MKALSRPVIFLQTHPIQYFAPMYRWLAAQGCELEVWYASDVSVAGGRDHEFATALSWDLPLLEGYRYRFLPGADKTWRGRRHFASLWQLEVVRWLKQAPPSYLVVHSWNYATLVMALWVAGRYGHRVAVKGDSSLAQEQLKPAWKRRLKNAWLRLLLRRADAACCIGRQNRLFYEQFRLPGLQLLWTPYAVDNDRWQAFHDAVSRAEARQRIRLDAGAFVVLCTAKYIPKKRPLDLLEAFRRLDHPGAIMLLVGEGMLRPQMEGYIRAHHMQDRVRITGFVNQTELPWYYRAADVFVLPSGAGENWGLSVNEAMNLELPVLVSNACGCADDLVQDGVNGFRFDAGDTDRLHERLSRMAGMRPEDRAVMGEHARRRINNYHYHHFLAALYAWDASAD